MLPRSCEPSDASDTDSKRPYRSRSLATTMATAAASVLMLLAACSPDDKSANTDAGSAAPNAQAQRSEKPQPQPVADSASQTRKPCDLMSPQEISAAAGLADNTGEASVSGGAQVCTWTDANGKAAVVQVHASAARYEQSRAAFESFYGGQAETVDIGDKAFFISGKTGPLPTATVSAQTGSATISVQVMEMNGDAAALRGAAEELARQMLRRL